MTGTPRRLDPDQDSAAVLKLVQETFAFMDGRIDPPSSVHRLTKAGIAAYPEVWVIDDDGLAACLFLTPKLGRLYLSKLAVRSDRRGRGLARRLISLAETRAQILGLPMLELQTRVELTENHAAFAAMGFRQTGSTAHPGFDRPTSLTFRKPVPI